MYFRFDMSYSSEYEEFDDQRDIYVEAESEEQARQILGSHYTLDGDDGYCGTWYVNSVEIVDGLPTHYREGYDFLTVDTPYSPY